MKEPVFAHCDRCNQESINGLCMCGTAEFEESAAARKAIPSLPETYERLISRAIAGSRRP